MKIYVAGPYTNDPEPNMRRAEEIGIQLILKGHTPFIPHKHSFGWEHEKRLTYNDFLRIDLEWLKACDAMVIFGMSKGVQIEIEFCKENGIQIFRSMEEVPNGHNKF